jgi:hypothetical protein
MGILSWLILGLTEPDKAEVVAVWHAPVETSGAELQPRAVPADRRGFEIGKARRVDLIDEERAPARGQVPQHRENDERDAAADQETAHISERRRGDTNADSAATPRLLHLQGISSKISRRCCGGPGETQRYRGGGDLCRIALASLAAKLPLLPTVVSPCSPLFCASIRIEAPIRRDTLLYDCGKSIVDLPATDLAAGNEPTLAYWLVISRSSAIALRAIAISFGSRISRGKAPGAF